MVTANTLRRDEDAQIIVSVLHSERLMREIVFKNNPAKQAAKVAEIDKALEALERLEARAKR